MIIYPESVHPPASSDSLETPPVAIDVPTSSHQSQLQLGESGDDNNTVRVCARS